MQVKMVLLLGAQLHVLLLGAQLHHIHVHVYACIAALSPAPLCTHADGEPEDEIAQ